MNTLSQRKLLFVCSTSLLIGWVAGTCGLANLSAKPTVQKADVPAFSMSARTGANIYLQTAAEYRACCCTVYESAEFRLEAMLKTALPKPAKPAVVMDLDETVLDNSAFQTFLLKNNLEYTGELWADFEQNYPQDVTLIPGAKHFIDCAENLGVTVVFISNRSELNRQSTKGALQRLLGTDPTTPIDRLYLRTKDGSFDKSSRREEVAAKYEVLMYFGDNLRDFSESFRSEKLPRNPTPQDCLKAIALRKSSADDALCHWGVDWFVIPNPVYGEWETLIGSDPEAIMHPSSMKTKTLSNQTESVDRR
jgi:5'-nucleotidase (lipoprotein e(P4) family)